MFFQSNNPTGSKKIAKKDHNTSKKNVKMKKVLNETILFLNTKLIY
jgi:hypothetical protein